MRFAHLAEHIYCRPWFITPAAHASIAMLFERYLERGKAEDVNLADMFPQRAPLAIDEEGIATIHVLGPLGKNLSAIEQSCGATGFEQIRADYDTAAQEGAKGILLRVDSPGGTVMGTPEIAALIGSKPVPTVAYTEDVMASAAYYIAAGADSIVASPSAEVGSIGVYIPWVDRSAQYAAAGLKPDPIVNTGGDLKALGFGGRLSDSQRLYLQSSVDDDFNAFKSHVRKFRTVEDSAMRGQTMSGASAVNEGLVNRLGDLGTARSVLRNYITRSR